MPPLFLASERFLDSELGRIDFRVAGGPFQDSPCSELEMADPRELGTAVILHWLLKESGKFPVWRQVDEVIQTFVGWTDSMTFAQFDDLLATAGVKTPSDLPDRVALESLQEALESGGFGVQEIRGDYFIAPLGPEVLKLPRSFTVFGQRFIPDSWALSKVVFDDVQWTEDEAT